MYQYVPFCIQYTGHIFKLRLFHFPASRDDIAVVLHKNSSHNITCASDLYICISVIFCSDNFYAHLNRFISIFIRSNVDVLYIPEVLSLQLTLWSHCRYQVITLLVKPCLYRLSVETMFHTKTTVICIIWGCYLNRHNQ